MRHTAKAADTTGPHAPDPTRAGSRYADGAVYVALDPARGRFLELDEEVQTRFATCPALRQPVRVRLADRRLRRSATRARLDIFKRILDEPNFRQTVLDHYAERLYGRLRAEDDQLGLTEAP